MEELEKILKGLDSELLLDFSEENGVYSMNSNIPYSLLELVNYLVKRCELAERYIEESPCDPDITSEQLKAYQEWQNFKNK
jgi:hypothetical protein